MGLEGEGRSVVVLDALIPLAVYGIFSYGCYLPKGDYTIDLVLMMHSSSFCIYNILTFVASFWVPFASDTRV